MLFVMVISRTQQYLLENALSTILTAKVGLVSMYVCTVVAEAFFHWSGKFISSIFITKTMLLKFLI